MIYLLICFLFLGCHGEEIEEELVAIGRVLPIQARTQSALFSASYVTMQFHLGPNKLNHYTKVIVDVNSFFGFQNNTKIADIIPLKLKYVIFKKPEPRRSNIKACMSRTNKKSVKLKWVKDVERKASQQKRMVEKWEGPCPKPCIGGQSLTSVTNPPFLVLLMRILED